MAIQEKLATGRGKWTPEYPYLGTDPVNYDDCISPEFFADEREAVFKRWWLYVGRVEQLPRAGSYFTRELPGLAALLIAKDHDGTVRAFHNICAHRGNKVMWQEHPGQETSGSCRTFHCKYHGWDYSLDGKVEHITNEDQFFFANRDGLAMPSVHCDVVAGFIFINLSKDPEPLREFLGEQLCRLEEYPFHLMTHRYSFTTEVKGNWKLAADTICEWYHPPYVHQKFLNTDPSKAEVSVPPIDSYHYDLYGRHFLNSVPGPPPLKPREYGNAGEPRRDMKWVYKLFRAGLFGVDDIPDIGPLPEFLNAGDIRSWGNDQWWVLPNLSVQIWARNYYILYTYLPQSVGEHIYNIDLFFVPPKTARERLAQEMTVHMTMELAMQDVNTVEAAHSSLAFGALSTFHLSDQELMIRSFHHTIRTAVEEYRAEKADAEKGSAR